MKRNTKKTISDFLSFLPDKQYIMLRYYFTFKRWPDLKHPKTYNEKLQWMKLYDHNPLYSRLVDKQEVKGIVENKNVDGLNIIPTLAVWDKPEDIDVSILPDSFVLKCTHDSGSVMIFHSKSEYDSITVKKHFASAMKRNQYKSGREWAYKNLIPRIIAEPLIVDESTETGGLKDYKFFCFDGKVKALFIATDRGRSDTDVKFDFYDENCTHINMKHGHENAIVTPEKPQMFDEMKRIAEELSSGLRAVRIDLYEVNDTVLLGEFTFYHHCGFVPFEPEEWDYTFGEWIKT